MPAKQVKRLENRKSSEFKISTKKNMKKVSTIIVSDNGEVVDASGKVVVQNKAKN